MFTLKDYDKLHAMWDGLFSEESSKTCAGCGMCCHNAGKTLFPGEYQWLVNKTGQHNTDWKSIGCLCYSLKTPYKPVICRIFPLVFKFDLKSPLILEKDMIGTYYTDKCQTLTINKENYAKAKAYLEFLFSDVHNRAWYLMNITASEFEKEDRKILADMGKDDVEDDMLLKRSIMLAFGLPVKEMEEFWDFNKK